MPSRGTAAQVTDTLPPPVDQHAPAPNITPATTAPIATTPPNPVTTVPVGSSALRVAAFEASNGSLYEPKVWSTRDGAAMTLNFWHPEAELYQVRHRPVGSVFWKWEKQTTATATSLTGLDASTSHVAEVRAYADGRWRGWNSITADA
jgi:hypothetical protein